MLSPHNTMYGHILSYDLTNSPGFVGNADSENFYDLHRDSSLEIYLLYELLVATSFTHSERFSLQKIVMKTSGGDINQGEHPEVCYTDCCTLFFFLLFLFYICKLLLIEVSIYRPKTLVVHLTI